MEIPTESKIEHIIGQTQFPFMRNVNLQCYLREQRTYLNRRYDLFIKANPDKKDISFRDYLEVAIWGGVAEQFQRERHRKYFSDDYLILDYN